MMTRDRTILALGFLLLVLAVNPSGAIPTQPSIKRVFNETVRLTANSMRAVSTVIPYEYYHLPFCRPAVVTPKSQSIAQYLLGDRMLSSPYTVNVKVDVACKAIDPCATTNGKLNSANVQAEADEVMRVINAGYRGHLSIDNLGGFNNGTSLTPSGVCNTDPETLPDWKDQKHLRGYALGVPMFCKGVTLLNNHLQFTIRYHQPDKDIAEYTIVGFTIAPYSVSFANGNSVCDANFNPKAPGTVPVDLNAVKDGKTAVRWTYSVKWVEDKKTAWASRWDAYLNTSEADTSAGIHWAYIVVTMLVALCAAAITTMALLRAVRRDCQDYNTQDPESLVEETGWKLVHGDVFREPAYVKTYAVVCGVGTQLYFTICVVLTLALCGFLSPGFRAGILEVMIGSFVLLSIAAGYVTSRILNTFDKKHWRINFFSAVLFPGALFLIFTVFDLVSWAEGASDAVPFGTYLELLVLWVFVCLVFNLVGSKAGYHHEPITFPCEANRLAREVPLQRSWLASPAVWMWPGAVPFVMIFLEVGYIFDALWLGNAYYVFVYLFFSFSIWTVSVIIVALFLVYQLLTHGEYRWMWRSFQVGASLSLWLLAYTAYYYWFNIRLSTLTGTIIYFTYMSIAAGGVGLAAGAVSAFVSLYFVRTIYAAIRVD